jgi:hypothetical protein
LRFHIPTARVIAAQALSEIVNWEYFSSVFAGNTNPELTFGTQTLVAMVAHRRNIASVKVVLANVVLGDLLNLATCEWWLDIAEVELLQFVLPIVWVRLLEEDCEVGQSVIASS